MPLVGIPSIGKAVLDRNSRVGMEAEKLASRNSSRPKQPLSKNAASPWKAGRSGMEEQRPTASGSSSRRPSAAGAPAVVDDGGVGRRDACMQLQLQPPQPAACRRWRRRRRRHAARRRPRTAAQQSSADRGGGARRGARLDPRHRPAAGGGLGDDDAFALSSSELSASQRSTPCCLTARGCAARPSGSSACAPRLSSSSTREWRDQVRRPPAHSQPPSAAAPSPCRTRRR